MAAAAAGTAQCGAMFAGSITERPSERVAGALTSASCARRGMLLTVRDKNEIPTQHDKSSSETLMRRRDLVFHRVES